MIYIIGHVILAKYIFEEGELEENAVVRKFRITAADGKNYNTIHYNLDMIISLGYRVKSKIATNFPALGYRTTDCRQLKWSIWKALKISTAQ